MLGEATEMSQRHDPQIRRRDVIRGVAAVTAGATAASTPPLVSASADSETDSEKRKARYRADSPEVQTFYRVNRYPGR
jgi:hypothetical protein